MGNLFQQTIWQFSGIIKLGTNPDFFFKAVDYCMCDKASWTEDHFTRVLHNEVPFSGSVKLFLREKYNRRGQSHPPQSTIQTFLVYHKSL